MSEATKELDPITQATVTIAWVIVLNKPFYPVYVWYLVGNGAEASLSTLLSVPFFLAIPFLARRSSLAARIALPLIGTVDTLFETKVFGPASGTELYLTACIMLVALSFREEEKWEQRLMAVLVLAVFIVSRNMIDAPLNVWSASELKTLFNLNVVSVASLLTFIALRYAGIPRA